jgi:hypothetical protein
MRAGIRVTAPRNGCGFRLGWRTLASGILRNRWGVSWRDSVPSSAIISIDLTVRNCENDLLDMRPTR